MKGIYEIISLKTSAKNWALLIVNFQVKQCNAFKGSYNAETFTYKNVSEEALGQHGVQLLMERDSSFFRPNVVGILCIGTKVSIMWIYITCTTGI